MNVHFYLFPFLRLTSGKIKGMCIFLFCSDDFQIAEYKVYKMIYGSSHTYVPLPYNQFPFDDNVVQYISLTSAESLGFKPFRKPPGASSVEGLCLGSGC